MDLSGAARLARRSFARSKLAVWRQLGRPASVWWAQESCQKSDCEPAQPLRQPSEPRQPASQKVTHKGRQLIYIIKVALLCSVGLALGGLLCGEQQRGAELRARARKMEQWQTHSMVLLPQSWRVHTSWPNGIQQLNLIE